ncbi:hypothetical protein [Flavobacterium sp. IMCC34518]|uniref:hypothetical protein n=1 Tax=Flavobacterium sp. IMCC34518 TaxID=3003623 RepID=UPI0024831109|nr:hypothetical protein [Flavobacterium sp. IMCC34518]
MKLNYFILLFGVVIVSCNLTKKKISQTTDTTMKANLIDGSWKVNYIMNAPKNSNAFNKSSIILI